MLLALVMVFALNAPAALKTEDCDKAESIKVGFICLHDESSTYDKLIDAAKAACKNAGLGEDQYIIKTSIPEARSATTPRPGSWTPAATSSSPTRLRPRGLHDPGRQGFPKVQFCPPPPAPKPTPEAQQLPQCVRLHL